MKNVNSGKKIDVRYANKKLNWNRLTTILLSLLMISIFTLTSVSSLEILVNSPAPAPDPEISIELDSNELEIDTSLAVTQPSVQVEGVIKYEAEQVPYVNINLTMEKPNKEWNCSVQPNKINLTLLEPEETIVVTIQSPAGLENGTEKFVSIIGTWSYIPDNPILPTEQGNIDAEHIKVIAKNVTAAGDGGDGGDGKKKDKDDEKSFLPGFESILLLTGVLVLIVFLGRRRR